MKNLLLFGVMLSVLFSCSKSDPEPAVFIDSVTLDLKFDKDHQYVVTKGSTALEGSSISWKSSDTLVGKIDKKGLFKARKIGQTTITGQVDGKTVESKVTISPYSTTFKEPYLVFGATSSVIKSNDKRIVAGETETALSLLGENDRVRGVIYLLENSKMSQVGVFFENSSAAVTEITRYYNERYPDHGLIDKNVVFLSDDRTYGMVMSVNPTLGYNVIYSPYKAGGRVSDEPNLETINIYKEALK